MFRSLAILSIRRGALLVGAVALLTVAAGALPRAPSSIDIPMPITDPADPFVVLQMGPIEVPMPILDPFIG